MVLDSETKAHLRAFHFDEVEEARYRRSLGTV